MIGAGSPGPPDFRPSASLANLRRRAEILAAVRAFFLERGVLEVDTPTLCAAGAVDRHLEPIPASYHPDGPGGSVVPRYLVTSPEHSLKRLLAAGSGPIYQLTRAFRDGERGRLHNPEFTILEWYRPGLDHHQLMDEVEALVRRMLAGSALALPAGPFDRLTYREAFLDVLGFDPHRISLSDLSRLAGLEGVPPPPGMDLADRDAWLNLLLAARVEPTLGNVRPAFLLDYPASQAALARLRPGDPPVAERFELHVRGVELANGYHELCDAEEQRRRFESANAARVADGRQPLPLDERFLAALQSGLPDCSGVALGVDRVTLLACGAASIDEVIAFPFERA
jgi:lysyl-tRNA synthetase class 2